MQYVVIERFRHGPGPVYERLAARGRLLPDGVRYRDSWVDADRLDRCFQLVEADDRAALDSWTAAWADLVAFEVVPVVSSAEAARRVG